MKTEYIGKSSANLEEMVRKLRIKKENFEISSALFEMSYIIF